MKIICIGRNYGKHAVELGNAIPEKPVIFCKPDTALLKNGESFYIPPFSKDVHHEVELVIRIERMGKSIPKQFASKYYSQISLGIDFTARDLQSELKSKGLPWELAKSFDHSALVGDFISLGDQNIQDIHFQLTKNGQVVQSGHSADMIFKVDEIISFVSEYFTLKTGDLIFTGTPEGVGPVSIGDQFTAQMNGKEILNFDIR